METAKEHIELATHSIIVIERFINVCKNLNDVHGQRHWEIQRQVYVDQREYYRSLLRQKEKINAG